MSAFTVHTNIEGNLATDVTLRQTASGKDVANFRVAVSTRSQAEDGTYRERSEFVAVVVWGPMAVNAAASFSKGTRVLIAGDLKQRQYKNNEGNTVYISELHADQVGLSLRWHVVAPGAIIKAKDAFGPAESVESEELTSA